MAYTFLYDLQECGTPRSFARNAYEFTPAVLSPDGRLLFIAYSLETAGALIDAENGLPAPTEDPIGAAPFGQAATFSVDGRLLAASSGEYTIKLWSTPAGRILGDIAPGDGGTFALAFSPDGRLLLSGGVDGTVRVWETATRSERVRLPADDGPVHAITISADGRRVASAGRGGRILVRDIYGTQAAAGKLDIDALWNDLGSADAARAHVAINRLLSSPETAVPLIASRLTPAVAVDPERLQQLLADLNHRRYATRQAAIAELRQLGGQSTPALAEAARNSRNAELRKRAAEVLREIDMETPSAERLAALRATELLEKMATTEARELIERLADGAPLADLTLAAQAARDRLETHR